MIIAIWLAFHIGSYKLIAISSAFSPIVLLRTSKSTYLGLKFYSKMRWWKGHKNKISRKPSNVIAHLIMKGIRNWAMILTAFGLLVVMPINILSTDATKINDIYVLGWAMCLLFPFMTLLSLLAAPFIRVFATLVTFLSDPFSSVSAIPTNWCKVIFCLDVFHPPEPVPGYYLASGRSEKIGRELRFDRFWNYSFHYAKKYKEDNTILGFVLYPLAFIFCLTFSLFMVIPSFVFRWSIKATAVIWSPIILLSFITVKKEWGLDVWVKILINDSWARLRVVYSTFVICAFFLKMFVYNQIASAYTWWKSLRLSQYLEFLFLSDKIAWWQLTSTVNSILAIYLFFYGRRLNLIMSDLKHKERNSERKYLTSALYFSGLLTVYTVVMCLSQVSQTMAFPPIGSPFEIREESGRIVDIILSFFNALFEYIVSNRSR